MGEHEAGEKKYVPQSRTMKNHEKAEKTPFTEDGSQVKTSTTGATHLQTLPSPVFAPSLDESTQVSNSSVYNIKQEILDNLSNPHEINSTLSPQNKSTHQNAGTAQQNEELLREGMGLLVIAGNIPECFTCLSPCWTRPMVNVNENPPERDVCCFEELAVYLKDLGYKKPRGYTVENFCDIAAKDYSSSNGKRLLNLELTREHFQGKSASLNDSVWDKTSATIPEGISSINRSDLDVKVNIIPIENGKNSSLDMKVNMLIGKAKNVQNLSLDVKTESFDMENEGLVKNSIICPPETPGIIDSVLNIKLHAAPEADVIPSIKPSPSGMETNVRKPTVHHFHADLEGDGTPDTETRRNNSVSDTSVNIAEGSQNGYEMANTISDSVSYEKTIPAPVGLNLSVQHVTDIDIEKLTDIVNNVRSFDGLPKILENFVAAPNTSTQLTDYNSLNRPSTENRNFIGNIDNDSNDSYRDKNRYENSDDSDATVKNMDLDMPPSHTVSHKKQVVKRFSDAVSEAIPKKKSRCEINMEQKDCEKNKAPCDPRLKPNARQFINLQNADVLIPSAQVLGTHLPKNKPTTNRNRENAGVKIKYKELKNKTSALDHIKETVLCSGGEKNKVSQNKDKRQSSASDFAEKESGIRFRNRNVSVFQDMTKEAEKPPKNCKKALGRQKRSLQISQNELNMEKVHSQIEMGAHAQLALDLPTIQQNRPPGEKPVSFENYKNQKSSTDSANCFVVQDPRLLRKYSSSSAQSSQEFNKELSYISHQQSKSLHQASPGLLPAPLPSPGLLPTLLPSSLHAIQTQTPSMLCGFLGSQLPHIPSISTGFLTLPVKESIPFLPSNFMDVCDTDSTAKFSSSPRQHSYSYTMLGQPSSLNSIRSAQLQPRNLDPRISLSTQIVGISTPIDRDMPYQRNSEQYDVSSILPHRIFDSVGVRVTSPNDTLVLILSWIPDWLKEVDATSNRQNFVPPLIYGKRNFPNNIPLNYKSAFDHFNVIFPLMLYDLFFRMHESWRRSNRDLSQTPFEGEIINNKQVDDSVDMEVKLVGAKKPFYPTKGQLSIITVTLRSKLVKKIFAYILKKEIYVENQNGSKKETVYLHLKIVSALCEIDKKQPITLLPFYSLSKVLNQIKALTSLDESPLRDLILNPSQPRCSKIVLERVGFICNSLRIITRSVNLIKEHIALDEPNEARILLVDSPIGTDLLSTIIAIADDLKMSEVTMKHRILICTRSAKRLEEIGLRLLPTNESGTLSPDIQTVILANTVHIQSLELKKLTLEEQVLRRVQSLKKIDDSRKGNPQYLRECSDDEIAQTHRNILKNCDVVLTFISQCHDKVIDTYLGSKSDIQFSFCIVDEAYTCTEPETFLPLLYGIKKLALVGDPCGEPRMVAAPITGKTDYYRPLAARISKVIK